MHTNDLSKQKIIYIVNPASQNGHTQKIWSKLYAQLPKGEHVWITTGPKHATALAAQTANTGASLVVVVGGDGTLNEVVNGLMQIPTQHRPKLTLLPRGTGGDFRKTVGIPTQLDAFLKMLHQFHVQTMDVGELRFMNHQQILQHHYFFNICSFGLSGLVDEEVNRSSKALGGLLSFLMGSVKALWRYRQQTVSMTIDEQTHITCPIILAGVCNGRYFGGGMKFAPMANPTDGIFEVVIWRALSPYEQWTKMWRIYTGGHLKEKSVLHHRAQCIRAESTQRVLLDIDGEALGQLPLVVQLIPQAIQMVCGSSPK